MHLGEELSSSNCILKVQIRAQHILIVVAGFERELLPLRNAVFFHLNSFKGHRQEVGDGQSVRLIWWEVVSAILLHCDSEVELVKQVEFGLAAYFNRSCHRSYVCANG